MLKKFNWGWGIALFYSGFVVFMLLMVWNSTRFKTELVTADYYGKELKYQEHLDKIKRTNTLAAPLQWVVSNKKVVLSFPAEMKGQQIRAEILFYRPDNSSYDVNMTCKADSTGICTVASEKLRHGAYNMQIDWSAGVQNYYNEGVIKIN